ncbi:glutathione S-transferase [Apiospora kogelbergensis]|uniref:glutathione S-transferase n=1 Tax=Apiospora kogelbergensis TaxID=1337665 RepID=UPI00312CC583
MAHVDTSLPTRPTGAAAQLADAHAAAHPLKLYGGRPSSSPSNPRGLVPTPAVPKSDTQSKDQKPLYESSVICEYLNDEYDDEAKHGPDLFPTGPAFIQHTPEKEYTIEVARQGGRTFWGTLRRWPAPWAKRMFLLDHYKPGGVGIPAEGQGGEDEVLWGRWRKWHSATMERQSVKDTWNDDHSYIQTYKRYAEILPMQKLRKQRARERACLDEM